MGGQNYQKKDAIWIGDPRSLAGQVVCSQYLNFAVMGGYCRNAICFYQAHDCDVQIWARGGATDYQGYGGHPVIVGGCLGSRFDLTCQQNYIAPDGTGGYGLGAWRGSAVSVVDPRNMPEWGSNSYLPPGTNGNEFKLRLEGGNMTGGLYCEAQPQQGGNNTYSGISQGFQNAGNSKAQGAGYGVGFAGGWFAKFKDMHVEDCKWQFVVRGTPNKQSAMNVSLDHVQLFGPGKGLIIQNDVTGLDLKECLINGGISGMCPRFSKDAITIVNP